MAARNVGRTHLVAIRPTRIGPREGGNARVADLSRSVVVGTVTATWARGQPATARRLPAYCNGPTPTMSSFSMTSRHPPTVGSQIGKPARGVPLRSGPPSKSVQLTMLSATASSLSSPQFAQFASNCVPENRGVGGSIPPLTTSTDSGRWDVFLAQIRQFGALSSRGALGRFRPDLCNSDGHNPRLPCG